MKQVNTIRPSFLYYEEVYNRKAPARVEAGLAASEPLAELIRYALTLKAKIPYSWRLVSGLCKPLLHRGLTLFKTIIRNCEQWLSTVLKKTFYWIREKLIVIVKWLKKEYRKEFVMAFFITIAFSGRDGYAMPITADSASKKAVDTPSAPFYLKPLSHVAPVQAVVYDVPEEVQPVDPPPPPVAAVSAPVSSAGSCSDWLAQAGIPVTYGVMELINGESGCRANAYNPSGACGIGQDINGCEVGSDPVAQLQWMNNYVLGRYGSWATAYSDWLSRSPHWY